MQKGQDIFCIGITKWFSFLLKLMFKQYYICFYVDYSGNLNNFVAIRINYPAVQLQTLIMQFVKFWYKG